MTVQEASHLWFFESHINSKRSQWLQSTLSELEEKTKGMLKLIEGDADTFAQRAEMYYKKRPELVHMIEDFYRSYRSLAERYDQLKLELVNRGISLKEWSFIDKPSAASSLIFDSESEVDDPSEGEEEQVESKLMEVREKKNFDDIFKVGIKRERSDLLIYSFDSELSEVSYPEPEETQVEFSKLEDSPERKSVIKPTIGKMEGTEVQSWNTAVPSFEQSKYLYGEPNNGQDENHALAESPINKKSENCVVKPMIEKVDNQFESLNREPNEGQDEYNLSEISDRKRDYLSHPLADGVKSKLENISDKLAGLSFEGREGLNYEREDENDALAESPRKKKSEICVVKPMIEKVDSVNEADKCFAQFESLNHEPTKGQDEYNLSEISDMKREYLSHPLADGVKSKSENIFDKLSGLSFEDREVLDYEREDVCYGSNLEKAREKKSDGDDAKKLMKEVERLKGENMGFKVELRMKDEEKREVIRQLSMSVDILKGENHDMKRFIRDSNNRSSLFEIRKLKGVFSKNLFGGNKFKFSTPLVAL